MKNNLDVDNNYTRNTNSMGYVFKTQQPGTVPLYRMWAQQIQNTSFTISEVERAHMKNNLYVDNNYTLNTNIMGYVFKTRQPGTVPLYRMWAQQTQNTSLTTSNVELNHMRNNLFVDNHMLTNFVQGYLLPNK